MAQDFLHAPTTGRGLAGFIHEALLYRGLDEFEAAVGRFVTDAMAAGEPTLVAVAEGKIDRLRQVLAHSDRSDLVAFADMAEVGHNPACIIPACQAFVDAHDDAPGVRCVTEPITDGQGADEQAECRLHESLVNDAFHGAVELGGPPFWLVCAYDAAVLEPWALTTATRTHPSLTDGESRWRSNDFRRDSTEQFGAALSDTPSSAVSMAFGRRDIATVRRFVRARAQAEGLDPTRIGDLVLAADEVVSNSLRHASGLGTISMWRAAKAMVCEVRDGGRIHEPLAGRYLPRPEQLGGRGLWMVNQLCDLAQVRSSAGGTTVRMHLAIP